MKDDGWYDSTSDKRTDVNVVRHEYRKLSDHEKVQIQTIKDMGAEYIAYLKGFPSSRELSIAITKMEESVMWAVKDRTK